MSYLDSGGDQGRKSCCRGGLASVFESHKARSTITHTNGLKTKLALTPFMDLWQTQVLTTFTSQNTKRGSRHSAIAAPIWSAWLVVMLQGSLQLPMAEWTTLSILRQAAIDPKVPLGLQNPAISSRLQRFVASHPAKYRKR